MFFEVPGLDLGAPKTDVKKSDTGKTQVSSKKDSDGSKSKAYAIEGNYFPSEKHKGRNDKEEGINSAEMSLKQASHLSKPVKIANRPSAKIGKDSGKSKLQQKMEKQLCGARFRYLNQKLYQSHSHEALNHFKEHPEDFDKYHEGFRSQVVHWPVNPVDLFIEQLEKDVKLRQQKLVTVDMGCGEAKILRHFIDSEFKDRIKVHSFDLAQSHPEVVICDMTKVPLPDSSVDVVIFCLSLMNTNFIEAIREARRILKPKVGVLRVAEVESRFEKGPNKFISAVEEIGFKKRTLDTQHKVFTIFEFVANDLQVKSNKSAPKNIRDQDIILKPCLYKKR